MKFRGKVIIILLVILSLGIVIQMMRLNTYMKIKTNDNIGNLKNIKERHLDTKVLNDICVYQKKVLLITTDIKDSSLLNMKDNITKTLDYMKKDYDIIKARELSNIQEDKYEKIILLINSVEEVKNINKVLNFAYKGGGVLFANGLKQGNGSDKIKDKLGIDSIGKLFESDGIKLLENIIIKGKGIEIKEDNRICNISSAVELKDKVKIYAEDSSGEPLLWSNKYGKGNIFCLNGTMLTEKISRGFLAGILSSMNEVGIYPIINAKMIFLDDFPSPVPEGYNDQIKRNYGLDIRRFYKEIWWPDMVRIATNNNVKYTGVMIGTYDDEVEDLSKSKINIDKGDFNYYARELFVSGGELGVHGYNHQPLSIRELNDKSLGYNTWINKEVMQESIKRVLDFIKGQLDKYRITTYVPPSNIISKEGIEVLKSFNKNFKIISSLFDVPDGDDAYEQEIDLGKDGIFNLPRITFNYDYEESTKWSLLNGINLSGYISHFIHPDDILDPERNDGKAWRELSAEFEEMNNDIYKNYPWIKATTSSEAAYQLLKYKKTKVYYEKNKDFIKMYCDNFIEPIEFILRTKNKINNLENCSIKNIDENIYLVKVKEPVSKISYRRS